MLHRHRRTHRNKTSATLKQRNIDTQRKRKREREKYMDCERVNRDERSEGIIGGETESGGGKL